MIKIYDLDVTRNQELSGVIDSEHLSRGQKEVLGIEADINVTVMGTFDFEVFDNGEVLVTIQKLFAVNKGEHINIMEQVNTDELAETIEEDHVALWDLEAILFGQELAESEQYYGEES